MSDRIRDILLNKNSPSKIPVWFMRQAGRYLPEYMTIRSQHPEFLSLVYHPQNATRVTMQPVERYNMDAAILFSDILVIPHALGYDVQFKKGEGPVLSVVDHNEKRIHPESINIQDTLSPIYETISKTRKELDDHKDLIGFCGAPWTVFCYMVQGHGKTDFPKARSLIKDNPDLAQILMDDIISSSIEYLKSQVDSGVDLLQIFDSWAGLLKDDEIALNEYIYKANQRIVSALQDYAPHIPIIGFPKGLHQEQLIDYIQIVGVQGLSIDMFVDIHWARDHLQDKVTVQGNLHPDILRDGGDPLTDQTRIICKTLSEGPFIFNLGHGIDKDTPVDHVEQAVSEIHKFKS